MAQVTSYYRIELPRARELLAEAVATQGPDFIYNDSKSGGGMWCFNVPAPSGYGKVKAKTGCLIGTALTLAGETLHTEPPNNRSTIATLAGIDHALISPDAMRYWQVAQWSQDNGASWGAALAAAEKSQRYYE
jgi:hypothetical protein